MTMLPPDAWVPVPLRWRHVMPSDVFVDRNGELWHVTGIGAHGAEFRVDAIRSFTPFTVMVDPDDVIPVLVPVSERDAVELTREQLGTRLIERRTTSLPSETK
jgi:hypothetical protein